jgi:hypothetical protein
MCVRQHVDIFFTSPHLLIIIIIMSSSGSSSNNTKGNSGGDIDEDTFANATWDDVTSFISGGGPTFVCGIALSDLNSKQLRTVCSKLSVKGVKNATKSRMLENIESVYANRKAYAEMGYLGGGQQDRTSAAGGGRTPTAPPRKEVQCTFRLLNILFSDAFAEDFATLGNVATRQLLDAGAAANDEHFWTRVQTAFVESDDLSYGQFCFQDDHILAVQNHIDPAKIVQHDWKKLRALWKLLNADYKAALTKYTVSGTHEQNFYEFCQAKLDVYYLHKKLEVRPQLTATVQANLPEACDLSSGDNSMIGRLVGGSSKSSDNTSKEWRRQGAGHEIAKAIREFGDAKRRSEIATLKLEFMAREETRREKEVLFSEWEFVNTNIRLFRATVDENHESNSYNPNYDPDNDEDSKMLDGLLKRRREQIGKGLGILWCSGTLRWSIMVSTYHKKQTKKIITTLK